MAWLVSKKIKAKKSKEKTKKSLPEDK